MCNKNCVSGCFRVDPPKGPFGIKLRKWWSFLLTTYILLAIIGFNMVMIGLSTVLVCLVGAKIPVLVVAVCLSVSTIILYWSTRRALRYWDLLYKPWFTGVTLPLINAKFPELKLEDIANVQRLDKIGAEFYEGPGDV